MKHSIIMTAYKEFELINRFIEHTPKDWNIYIHLDKKVKDKKKCINKRAKVISTYPIKWGSISHLCAILDLLRIACRKADEETYFHIVTGQDYYVTLPERFDNLMENGKIYMDMISDTNWYDGGKSIYRYRTLVNLLDLRKPFFRKINRTYMKLQDYLGLCKSLPEYPIYGGSVYCSLPYDAVQYVLKSDMAEHLLNNLKSSAIGEEIFFQTVLMNSVFKDRIVPQNLRYSDWSVVNAPKILTKEDAEKILSSKKLFCRKLTLKESQELLNIIPNENI